MLRRAGAGCSKRNFGDKTAGDSERPRDSGFVGVLPRWCGTVRPCAAAVGAPGGNAGGCREFLAFARGVSMQLRLLWLLCGLGACGPRSTFLASQSRRGCLVANIISGQPREGASPLLAGRPRHLFDRPFWTGLAAGASQGEPRGGEAFRSASEPILVGRNDPYSGGDRCGPSRLCRRWL